MYPLNDAHDSRTCPECTGQSLTITVTDADRASFAYWLSDPNAKSFFLSV